jgi:hypothetical protein
MRQNALDPHTQEYSRHKKFHKNIQTIHLFPPVSAGSIALLPTEIEDLSREIGASLEMSKP